MKTKSNRRIITTRQHQLKLLLLLVQVVNKVTSKKWINLKYCASVAQ